jgi:inosose dehydratase
VERPRHGISTSRTVTRTSPARRKEQWDYFAALRHGVFCELGKGGVDFPAVLRWLKQQGYTGYALVEQDVLPGMGSPKESARRNREYLRIETN